MAFKQMTFGESLDNGVNIEVNGDATINKSFWVYNNNHHMLGYIGPRIDGSTEVAGESSFTVGGASTIGNLAIYGSDNTWNRIAGTSQWKAKWITKQIDFIAPQETNPYIKINPEINGTTTVQGRVSLSVGNAIAEGSAENYRGFLTLYNGDGSSVTLYGGILNNKLGLNCKSFYLFPNSGTDNNGISQVEFVIDKKLSNGNIGQAQLWLGNAITSSEDFNARGELLLYNEDSTVASLYGGASNHILSSKANRVQLRNFDTTEIVLLDFDKNNMYITTNRIVAKGIASTDVNTVFCAMTGTAGDANSYTRLLELGTNPNNIPSKVIDEKDQKVYGNARGKLQLWGRYHETGVYESDCLTLKAVSAANQTIGQVAFLGLNSDHTTAQLVLGKAGANAAYNNTSAQIILYGNNSAESRVSLKVDGYSNLYFERGGIVLHSWAYGTSWPDNASSPTGRLYFYKV